MPDEGWSSTGGYDLDSSDSELEIVDDGYRRYRRPDAEEPGEREEKQAKARQRFILGAIGVVAALVITVLLGSGGPDQSEEDQLQGIGSLEEAHYLFALEDTFAVGHIRRSFKQVGDRLPFEDGVVATYLFLQHPVEIWVGIALLQESADQAINMLLSETDPANPDTDWRTQSSFTRGTVIITQVVGKGQRNYFFRDSNMVVWVKADSIAGTFALSAVLNTNLRNWMDSIRQGGR